MAQHELLVFAMRLHRENKLDAAEKCYRSLLSLDANDANAMHYLGVLLHQRGERAAALPLIEASIFCDPTVASWHNNLGNVLLAAEQFDAAAAAYVQCTELAPDNLEVLCNLGVLYRKMERPADAEAALLQALARDPQCFDAHNNLATLYTTLNRMPEAFSHFADALTLRPDHPQTRRLLLIAYGKAGRFDEGRKLCVDWLEQEPDNPQAKHFLAAFGGTAVPERASDQYVAFEFDGFAKSFDAKLASLDYKAPQRVGETVARLLGNLAATHKLLDAGCGTGLCAPYLRPYARQLIGVDLSANMLERARERGLYDSLVQAELVSYLQACDADFDVIVSADTLCYFGRLDLAFAAVRRALRTGGHWVFTVEAHAQPTDFVLHIHGRYSHARVYLENELARAGFSGVDIQSVDLRFENREPVAGWLVAAC